MRGRLLGICLCAAAVIAAWALTPVAWAAPIPDSPDKVTPLLIGAQPADVALRTVDGESVELLATLRKKPTIVIFYRGGW